MLAALTLICFLGTHCRNNVESPPQIPHGISGVMLFVGRNWNHLSEFFHRGPQNNSLGPTNIVKLLIHNHSNGFEDWRYFI